MNGSKKIKEEDIRIPRRLMDPGRVLVPRGYKGLKIKVVFLFGSDSF